MREASCLKARYMEGKKVKGNRMKAKNFLRAVFGVLTCLMLCQLFFGAAMADTVKPPKATITSSVLGGAQKVTADTYVWTPTTQNNGHQVSYRVTYDVVGSNVKPGEICITIPLHVLATSVNPNKPNWADTLTMSVPEYDEAVRDQTEIDNDVQLAYKIVGDDIRIMNFRKLDGNFEIKGYVEVGYTTTLWPGAYPDVKQTDNTGFKFPVTLTVPKSIVSSGEVKAEAPKVFFDTAASISKTNKQQPTLYETWPTGWGTAPTGADDYIYLAWPVTSDVFATQAYTMQLKDTCGELTNPIPDGSKGEGWDEGMTAVGCIFARQSQVVLFDTQNEVSIGNQTISGSRTDTVITKIKKTAVANLTQWTATNTIKSIVIPSNTADAASDAGDTEVFGYHKPVFNDPPGDFNGWKRADGAYHSNPGHYIYYGTSGSEIFNNSTMRAARYSSYALEDLKNGAPVSGLDYAAWVHGRPNKENRNNAEWDKLCEDAEDADGKTVRVLRDNVTKEQVLACYGINDFKFTVIDEDVRIFPTATDGELNAVILNKGDYAFTSIQYGVSMYGWDFNTSTKRLTTGVHNQFNSGETIEVYIKTDDNASWTLYCTIPLDPNDTAHAVDNTKVRFDRTDRTLGTVTFPANTIGYKLETTNKGYSTSLGAVANLTIYPTQKVLEMLADDAVAELSVLNHMNGQLYRMNGQNAELIFDQVYSDNRLEHDKDGSDYKGKSDTNYIRRALHEATLNKEVVGHANNPAKRAYEIRWRIPMTETIRTDGGLTNVDQPAGSAFYDLLPESGSLDEKSVEVYDATIGGYLPRSSYTVTQTANYNGTSRTLVKVVINQPGTNFILTFKSVHAWDNMPDRTTQAENWVAYETGNLTLPRANGLTNDQLPAQMRGLDPDVGTANRFLFAKQNQIISSLRSSSFGIRKQVRALVDDAFKTRTIVMAGKEYVYRIRMEADASAKQKSLIIFDKLEAGQKDTGAPSQWHGTLTGVDLSNLKKFGVKPVLMYSTNPAVAIPQSVMDSMNYVFPADWTAWDEVTPLDSLPITAVAVDLRRDTAGDEFIMQPGQVLMIQFYMKAPEQLPNSPTMKPGQKYPEAYNYVSQNSKNEGDGVWIDVALSPDEVTVEYDVVADIPLIKQGTTEGNPAIQGVTYLLEGYSDYDQNNLVQVYAVTDMYGKATFEQVERGKYYLREYESPEDWLLSREEYEVIISETGALTIDGKPYSAANLFVVRDDPRIHTDMTFLKMSQKTDSIAKQPIEGITFKLTGMSDYGNEHVRYATSNEKGEVRFNNLEKNTSGYIIEELNSDWDEKSPYLPLPGKLKAIVTENADVILSFLPSDSTMSEEEKEEWLLKKSAAVPVPEVYNQKSLWEFSFRKVDASVTPMLALPGAQFRLWGTSELGYEYEDDVEGEGVIATSDESGVVTFRNIQKGIYSMEEITAPVYTMQDGTEVAYQLDPTVFRVTISEDGAANIYRGESDTTAVARDATGMYIPNSPAVNNKLTVYKQWDDDGLSQRPVPQVDILASGRAGGDDYIIVNYVANSGFFKKPNDTTHYTVNRVVYQKNADGTISLALGTQYLIPMLRENENPSKFRGWYTSPECEEADIWAANEQSILEEVAKLTEPLTVYAKWPEVYDYDYTGAVQYFVAPKDGWYQFEAWGAQGGDYVPLWKLGHADNTTYYGGKGAYATGYVELNAGDQFYVYVGGSGDNDGKPAITNPYNSDRSAYEVESKDVLGRGHYGGYNGGGRVQSGNDEAPNGDDQSFFGRPGGGATDFRLVEANDLGTNFENNYDSDMVNMPSYKSRILVAAGGGGANGRWNYNGTCGSGHGGYGGALEGGPGTSTIQNVTRGGTQTAGGTWTANDGCTIHSEKGRFFFGGRGQDGGGGGYYGGAACAHVGGAGGSSYINGYPGCDTTYQNTAYLFTGGSMIAGNAEMPQPDDSTAIGHSGNGYARITYLGPNEPQTNTSGN